MRTLVIDDMRVIHGLPNDAVVCRTLARGTRELFGSAWGTVYLDHDLGLDETIRPLVLELAQRAHDGVPAEVEEFVVITDNPAGREWIASTLARAGYTVRHARPACDYDYDELIRELKEEKSG
jgi:hypothetical protein